MKTTQIQNKSNGLIQIKNLSKLYSKGKIRAVDDLELTINQGETFGLLGPNGAGKTTTIRLLNGLIKPTSGTASINGFDILEDTQEVKTISGLLAESPGVYAKLSAYEFLEFMGALYNIPKSNLKTRINELLTFFDLLDRKNDLIEGFSTGMRQKVLLASAIIHDPEVIFLDEPTAGLDPRAARMVKQLVKDFSNRGKTILISSHRLPVVEELCDRIGIIHNGQLIAIGTISDIIDQTQTQTLEEAFITITGGNPSSSISPWRA
ncbi:MAG: ABC transporter ATP-binding protein [Candidatus Hodarchaeales archaeon]|jgi:ABC-2 type transport system ATP-binding protein